jgi:hypothetical protein
MPHWRGKNDGYLNVEISVCKELEYIHSTPKAKEYNFTFCVNV